MTLRRFFLFLFFFFFFFLKKQKKAISAALSFDEPTRSNAVVYLIPDVMEPQTTEVNEGLFLVVERHGDEIAAILAQGQKLRNFLLSYLVDLYRGTGPARHALFRARILKLLSLVMPAFDRSGLNMKGSIASSSMDLDATVSRALLDEMDEHKGLKLDYGLFASFWRLQQAISRGSAVLNKGGLFDSMVGSCELVLGAIQSCPSPKLYKEDATAFSAEGISFYRDPEVLLAHFSPEFDRRGHFKVQVLVQLAIYLAHVQAHAKAEHHLSALKELSDKVYDEVRKLVGDTRALRKLLEVDALWHQWRVDGAKVEALPEPLKSKIELVKGKGPLPSQSKVPTGMGDVELTRLWALSEAQPVIQPEFASFVERVLEDADPENDIEEEYQARSKAQFQWQMLRAGLDQCMGKLNEKSLFKGDLLAISQHVYKLEHPEEHEGEDGEEDEGAEGGEEQPEEEKEEEVEEEEEEEEEEVKKPTPKVAKRAREEEEGEGEGEGKGEDEKKEEAKKVRLVVGEEK
jgi:hypothetical protein